MKISRAEKELYDLPLNEGWRHTRVFMGEDSISGTVSVPDSAPLEWSVGDYIEWKETRYSLADLPDFTRKDGTYTYPVRFYAPYHRLSTIFHRMKIVNNESEDESESKPKPEPKILTFSYFGTLKEHLGLWSESLKDGDLSFEVQAETPVEKRGIDFDQNYLSDALTRICEAFSMEYSIIDRKIVIGTRIGADKELTFEYGRGKGLYSLQRLAVTNGEIITRLYGVGSSENLPVGYRGGEQSLVFTERYVENNVGAYGLREGVITFDTIYPRLKEARVVSLLTPVADRETANTWKIKVTGYPSGFKPKVAPNQTARIVFNSGDLMGETFDVSAFETDENKNDVIVFCRNQDYDIPLPSPNRVPKANDRFVLLGISLPETYVTEAENELKAATEEKLKELSQMQYAHKLELDPRYVKKLDKPFFVGDKVAICDRNFNAKIRVLEMSHPLTDENQIEAVISDEILYSYDEKLAGSLADVSDRVQDSYQQAKIFSRRAYREAEEAVRMSADAIRAEMALIGKPEGQFVLTCSFQANRLNPKDSSKDYLDVSAGELVHEVYTENAMNGHWYFTENMPLPLTNPNLGYYLYAKCAKSLDGESLVIASEKPMLVEPDSGEESNFYFFPIGTISSQIGESSDGSIRGLRGLNITTGYTLISGNNIRTGRLISSRDPNRYLDLDSGEFKGKVTFSSGSSGLDNTSEWEQIDNQNVPYVGLNLLRNSGNLVSKEGWNIAGFGTNGYYWADVDKSLYAKINSADANDWAYVYNDSQLLPFDPDTEYTLSLRACCFCCRDGQPTYTDFPCQVQISDATGENEVFVKPITLTKDYRTHTFSFKPKSVGNQRWVRLINLKGVGVNGYVNVLWMKLERGNKATDWCPALEEMQDELRAQKYLSDAIRDGKTSIEGGLIMTGMLCTQDTVSKAVTAGISGKMSDEVIFFADKTNRGDAYLLAKDNKAMFQVNKAGTGRWGVLSVTNSGEVNVNGTDGLAKVRIGNERVSDMSNTKETETTDLELSGSYVTKVKKGDLITMNREMEIPRTTIQLGKIYLGKGSWDILVNFLTNLEVTIGPNSSKDRAAVIDLEVEFHLEYPGGKQSLCFRTLHVEKAAGFISVPSIKQTIDETIRVAHPLNMSGNPLENIRVTCTYSGTWKSNDVSPDQYLSFSIRNSQKYDESTGANVPLIHANKSINQMIIGSDGLSVVYDSLQFFEVIKEFEKIKIKASLPKDPAVNGLDKGQLYCTADGTVKIKL